MKLLFTFNVLYENFDYGMWFMIRFPDLGNVIMDKADSIKWNT